MKRKISNSGSLAKNKQFTVPIIRAKVAAVAQLFRKKKRKIILKSYLVIFERERKKLFDITIFFLGNKINK